MKVKLLQKYLSVCLVGSVLVFSACSDDNSMSDTKIKDLDYYKANKEEAVKKAQWCFNKGDISKESIEAVIDEAKRKNEIYFLNGFKNIVDKLKETKKFNEVDIKNCYRASQVFVLIEIENRK
ncbi:hypothetical protein K8T27_000887 [Campylobacter upsaliensis]|uniref:Lipoprotein n=1 Tax=Campylobacter upsaliensis TaxID=28080 RepID=A0A7U8B4H3_CAMUP|nr:hypothetical protein [Campylobacter vulpis]EAH8337967.1 hypothetical protein [Campylobacter upsaliensis]EAH8539721.1 hypothetical protein [Campylobacter upsaliensis]EAI0016833.1 hypothetical protein [Campylobacter upsaliensis]EAI0665404.1 hypothetical protein [Campylobacter upsaliensis]EAI0687239.1 hypothetical protein [Campylobacter upsaliensis]